MFTAGDTGLGAPAAPTGLPLTTMHDTRPSAGSWRSSWRLDDEALRDSGLGGELLVARIRIALCALLLLIPLRNFVEDPSSGENYVGLGMLLVANALALATYVAARRDALRRSLGFLSATLDVCLVSATLTIFLVLDMPHTATNSKVVFEMYLLAIAATCLRYDRRVCVGAGALAILQYAAIVAYADRTWDLNSSAFAPFAYGMFSWSAQISRLILLAAATALSTAIVIRAEQLRRLSTRDRLTGLYNRGYFDERLEEELRRAARGRVPLSVALLDLDHFKQFNDTHGHVAGDAALRAFAGALRASLRLGDVPARFGGEEFIVLMPGTTVDNAVATMERVRREVAETTIKLPGTATSARITTSVGVAGTGGQRRTAEELIRGADARLFEAKRLGRDRVVGPTQTLTTGELMAVRAGPGTGA
jgi:diguanylate cyclase (GGDEF)-like protein